MSKSNDILWTCAEIAALTKGRTTGTWNARGLAFDSRLLRTGEIFIALRAADFPTLGGGTSDGHAYITRALDSGAAGVIADQIPAELKEDPRIIQVNATRDALTNLAIAARANSGARIFAITGSVGKTSTREMLRLALSPFGSVYASDKNYNNEMGVPVTLCNMPQGADYAVVEMGMNHANEIRPLTHLVRPHVAIITNIAPAHIANFENGLDGIADAKAEIFEGLEPGGIAILPRDCPQFDRLARAAQQAKAGTILSFGTHESADARVLTCIEGRNGTQISAQILGQTLTYTIPAGPHQAMNALAVLLAVAASNLNPEKAATALANFSLIPGRGKEEKLNIGDPDNPVILIDEAYNASPEAMKAAFRVVALIDPGRGGRRIAVLGDMLELGDQGPTLHADLALPLRAANIDLVYTCGTLMKHLHDALPANQRGIHRDNSAQLAQIVPDVLVPGDVVVVKGSHGSRMNLVVEALRALPEKRGTHQDEKGQNRHAL